MIDIHNRDCLDFMDAYTGRQIDLIVSDPPYLFDKSPGKPYSERKQCNTKSSFSKSELYNNDGMMMREMASFTEEDIVQFLDKTKRIMGTYNAYYFASEKQVPIYCNWATNNKLMYSILVWEKPLTIINKNRFSQNLEYIMRIYDYGTALNKSPINKLYNRVKRYNPPHSKEHLTQKPLSLIKEFLILSKKEGMLVYDPFAGSGTTLIACWEMNIDCIGTEINKEVYEVAHNRVDGCKRQQKLFSYDGN